MQLETGDKVKATIKINLPDEGYFIPKGDVGEVVEVGVESALCTFPYIPRPVRVPTHLIDKV